MSTNFTLVCSYDMLKATNMLAVVGDPTLLLRVCFSMWLHRVWLFVVRTGLEPLEGVAKSAGCFLECGHLSHTSESLVTQVVQIYCLQPTGYVHTEFILWSASCRIRRGCTRSEITMSVSGSCTSSMNSQFLQTRTVVCFYLIQQ